jgi:hypothetical protein
MHLRCSSERWSVKVLALAANCPHGARCWQLFYEANLLLLTCSLLSRLRFPISFGKDVNSFWSTHKHSSRVRSPSSLGIEVRQLLSRCRASNRGSLPRSFGAFVSLFLPRSRYSSCMRSPISDGIETRRLLLRFRHVSSISRPISIGREVRWFQLSCKD